MVDIFSIDSLLGAVIPYAIPILFVLVVIGIVYAVIRSLKFVLTIVVLGVVLLFLLNTFAPSYSPVNASTLYNSSYSGPLDLSILNPTPKTNQTTATPQPSEPAVIKKPGVGNPENVKITNFIFGLRASNGMFQRSYIRPTEQLTINYFYSGAVTGDTFTIRVLRADSDVQVAEFVTIAKDTGYVLVSVNPPNGAWLAGPYRIDVYYNDVKIKDGTVLCVPEPR